MNLFSFFKICTYCQSLFTSKYPLCAFCKAQLEKRLEYKTYLHEYGFKVHYLYDWYPSKDDFMSALLLSAKNQTCKIFWEIFSKNLIQHIDDKFDLFIPSPAKNLSLDHAARLSLATEHCYNNLNKTKAYTFFCLNKNQEKTQRFLSKLERKSISIELSEFAISCKKVNKVMFIDDVITTGNTAKSAIKSLRAKFTDTKLEIFVIARRHLDPKLS